jgi:hypothetical protein
MPDSLQELESRRADLVKQIAGLGDLRSGSIPIPAVVAASPSADVTSPVIRCTVRTFD